MKVDLYTKTVLTVIALCLLYFVAKEIPIVQEAKADMSPMDLQMKMGEIHAAVVDDTYRLSMRREVHEIFKVVCQETDAPQKRR